MQLVLGLHIQSQLPVESTTLKSVLSAKGEMGQHLGLCGCVAHNYGCFRYMGIGLSCLGVNLNRLPGWEKNSYGYHADDGCVFSSSATGQSYGPTFTTGDVVGCGFNLVSRSIFFTKNGINLGVATSDLPVISSLTILFKIYPSSFFISSPISHCTQLLGYRPQVKY